MCNCRSSGKCPPFLSKYRVIIEAFIKLINRYYASTSHGLSNKKQSMFCISMKEDALL